MVGLRSNLPIRHFIFDFDKTISTSDTTGLILTSGPKTHLQADTIARLVSAYDVEYKQHLSHDLLPSDKRITLHSEIEAHRSFRNVEMRSFGRVSESGLLAGVTAGEWQRKGKEAFGNSVRVRDGWVDLIANLQRQTNYHPRWAVVSVSFEKEWVRGFCAAAIASASKISDSDLAVAGRGSGSSTEWPDLENVSILANASEADGVLKGPCLHGRHELVVDCRGKLACLESLLECWELRLPAVSPTPKLPTEDDSTTEPPSLAEKMSELPSERVVYVGDSATDIECLTRKGVLGIIMIEINEAESVTGEGTQAKRVKTKESLVETLKRVGVQVRHISKFESQLSEADIVDEDLVMVYWARDFAEISAVLLQEA